MESKVDPNLFILIFRFHRDSYSFASQQHWAISTASSMAPHSPPLRQRHPRKRAATRQRTALHHQSPSPQTPRSSSSSSSDEEEDPAPLWKQVRALERSRRHQKKHRANLQRSLDEAQKDYASRRDRQRRQSMVVLGDYHKVLREKQALERELAQATTEQQRSTQDAQRDLAKALLEVKIYRCAMQAVYMSMETDEDKQLVRRALELSRAHQTGTAAPPSMQSAAGKQIVPYIKRDEDEEVEEAEAEVQTPRRRAAGGGVEMLTPGSMPRANANGGLIVESGMCETTPTRREGLRPRRHHVDMNGSPW